MMMRQARRSSAIQHYTVRCGFLSQRSYVALADNAALLLSGPEANLLSHIRFQVLLDLRERIDTGTFCCRATPNARKEAGIERPAMMLSLHPGQERPGGVVCCKCAPALPHFFFPGCPACPHLPCPRRFRSPPRSSPSGATRALSNGSARTRPSTPNSGGDSRAPISPPRPRAGRLAGRFHRALALMVLLDQFAQRLSWHGPHVRH